MFTKFTYQDWVKAEGERGPFLLRAVELFRRSDEFRTALEASAYFSGNNSAIAKKRILKANVLTTREDSGRTARRLYHSAVPGSRIASGFLFRFVTQQSQYLLSNGVTLGSLEQKKRLGLGFDSVLEEMGEKALLHGVAWGFWNLDHLEMLPMAQDEQSGFFALLDEVTGAPRVGIQFWQIHPDKPRWIRVFEEEGVTLLRTPERKKGTPQKTDMLEIVQPRKAYKRRVALDGAGENLLSEGNWGALPVIPLYANSERRSEFTPAIRSKIDLYDRILSDFGDNLERANDVYWVLNNFGGGTEDVLAMLEGINKIKAVINQGDGGGGASAEAKTIEVPYAARCAALELLEKQLYADFMAMNMESLAGGSLTNVAIKTSMTNLNLKTDRFEWQCFVFVQKVLNLLGMSTERIYFARQSYSNRSEIVSDIQSMRGDIDQETALRLNPYIDEESIPLLLARSQAEEGQQAMDTGKEV